jgi:BspA type Leucine rich repeat region (6 copies)
MPSTGGKILFAVSGSFWFAPDFNFMNLSNKQQSHGLGSCPRSFGVKILALLLLLLPMRALSQFGFFLNSDHTYILGNYFGPGGDVVIPATNNGAPVGSIAEQVFYGLTNLTSVVIPATVTNIGNFAFTTCPGLTNVIIPNSVSGIGDFAFEDCSALMSATIPGSLTNMGTWVFAGCTSLTNATINSGAACIGDHAFQDCPALGNVFIPASVTNIGVLSFFAGTNLTAITVDSNNPGYSSVAGVLFDKHQSMLLQFPNGKAGDYTVPASVTSIADSAFGFAPNVTSIAIPAAATSIGSFAIEGCSALTNITVDPLNPAYSSLAGVLFDKNRTTLIQYPGGVTGGYKVPSMVTNIEDGAFSYDFSITNISLPAGLVSIGNFALNFCTSLGAISVDSNNPAYSSLDGVLFDKNRTTLVQFPAGKSGFYIVPAGVTDIGYLAISDCLGLTSVTLPASVTNLDFYDFSYCPNLAGVYFEGDEPETNYSVFYGDNPTIYYLPGRAGWDSPFAGMSNVPWLPQMQMDTNFGVQNGRFGFNIFWATNQTVTVEAAANPVNPAWVPLQTNTLTSNLTYFSDPQWSNYPTRFYRLTSP